MFWFQERLRDLALWPINLIRDFPRRSGRFFRTCHCGIITFLHFPAELQKAKQQKNATRRFGAWSHLFIIQLFDLFGGPEIAQFFMHLITHTTPLTPTEIDMMQSVLGKNSMRYHDIRVAQGGLMKYVFKYNGNLAFATWYTINLPQHHGRNLTTPARQNLPIVVHELTHVYQYHHVGSRYMTEAIFVLLKYNRDCYKYGGVDGLAEAVAKKMPIAEFNREQQAQIVQDYFTRQLSKDDVTKFLPFIDQIRAGQL